MVKHIVMWKLKEQEDQDAKVDNARKIKEAIDALKEKIPVIKEIEIGFNFNPSDAAYDVLLYSVFESKEDLDIYQKHPEHVIVADFIKKVTAGRAVVDYNV